MEIRIRTVSRPLLFIPMVELAAATWGSFPRSGRALPR
jgi:hypothetical protein